MPYRLPLWPEHFLACAPVPSAELALSDMAVQLGLTADTLSHLVTLYQPLAGYLSAKANMASAPLLVGINGAQGTGKSTAAAIIKAIAERGFGASVCALSIDDLYLSRAERSLLAETVHPLLATRGVPGTHNLPLAMQLLDDLTEASSCDVTLIPRFNKAQDDCYDKADWEPLGGRPDIVLLEGWCVGARPQRDSDLTTPCNTLETEADPKAIWRRYVNQKLHEYQALFDRLSLLIMLKAPSFEQVYEWRQLQEDKLRQSLDEEALKHSRVMSADEVRHFIAHYERLTRWMLREMPGRAHCVLSLNAEHQIEQIACQLAP